MRVYDTFKEEYIDENEMEIIAPPERYIQVTEDLLIKNAAKFLVEALMEGESE